MQVQEDDPLVQPIGQSLQQGREGASPAPGVDIDKLRDGWNSWIDKPNNRAALMQFGIAMLQPIGMGETGTSHFANAIGAAGEAHQRVTGQEQQARKEDTAATLRESTAAAREQSAQAAEIRAGMTGQLSEGKAENARLRADNQTAAAYQNYVTQTQKANSDPLRTAPADPILGPEEWAKSRGLGASTMGGGAPPTSEAKGWDNIQRDPRIHSSIATIRQMVATGNQQQISKAKQYIETVIVPRVDPSEVSRVYAAFGITR